MTKKTTYLAGILILAIGVPAHAEFYVGGQVGANIPQDFTDVKGIDGSSGITLSDLELRKMIVFGGKFGGFLPGSFNWLGFETEAYQTDSDIDQQPVTVSAPILGLNGTTTIPRTDIAITTWAFNAIVRYPGKTFQPYGGIGVGVNFARLSGGVASSELSIDPTLNLLAGLRAFVTDRLALFGEYKHNRGTLKFSDNQLEGDYRTNMFLGGISYHWRQ